MTKFVILPKTELCQGQGHVRADASHRVAVIAALSTQITQFGFKGGAGGVGIAMFVPGKRTTIS
jgi:hypothetical protein